MFKNDEDYDPINVPKTTPNAPEPETIIGPSVRVEGNFRGDGNVMVEGEVKGSIKTKKDVRVGQNAKVNANIDCINAYISGEIHGNIKTKEKLELSATARIMGDIVAKSLQITSGAKINGVIKMDEDSLNPPAKEKSTNTVAETTASKNTSKSKKK